MRARPPREETGLPITATVGSSRYAGDFAADETAAALVQSVEVVSVGAAQRDGETLTCPVTFRVTMQAPEDIGIYRILLSASAQSPGGPVPDGPGALGGRVGYLGGGRADLAQRPREL